MAQQETHKQQIARRLRVSESVLEQYLQLKRAEVEEAGGPLASDTRTDSLPRLDHRVEQNAGHRSDHRADRAAETVRRKLRERRIS